MNIKTWIAAGTLAVVVVGGSITGAVVHNASVQADVQAHHVLVVKAAKVAADQVAAAAAAAQAVIDAAAAQKVLDDAAAAQAAAVALAAQQAAQAAADAAARAVVIAPVAKAPVQRSAVAAPSAPKVAPVESQSRNLPSGTLVPLLDAATKFYDISACASGKASGAVPVCD